MELVIRVLAIIVFVLPFYVLHAGVTALPSMEMTLDQSVDPTLSLPDDSKGEGLNPIRKIAKDFRSTVQMYREQRALAQKRGDVSQYDELLKEAEIITKEIEAASMQHDAYMARYQEGDTTSGEQAIRLTAVIQAQSQPFKNILMRMNSVITQQIDTSVPQRPYHKKFAPTAHSAPPTRYLQSKTTEISESLNRGDPADDTEKPLPMSEGRARSTSEHEIDPIH